MTKITRRGPLTLDERLHAAKLDHELKVGRLKACRSAQGFFANRIAEFVSLKRDVPEEYVKNWEQACSDTAAAVKAEDAAALQVDRLTTALEEEEKLSPTLNR
jgi:hypothetical protein